MIIKQVIVVEGKTDSLKLKTIFGQANVETIETNGLAIDKKTLQLIKQVNNNKGIIIFTDPDGPGVKIRDKINEYLDFKCLNAFINKKNITGKKIGIAEASNEDIKNALNNLIEFNSNFEQLISWQEYLDNEFYIKENREKIANHFNWNHKINSKKLFKWINLSNLTKQDILNIIGE